MKKFILTLIIVLFLILFIIIGIIKFLYTSLIDISENDKNELMNLLEIEEALSFTPLYKKLIPGAHARESAYELKFIISKEDYIKNGLKYSDDKKAPKYKKKIKSYYICTIIIPYREGSRELFVKANKL